MKISKIYQNMSFWTWKYCQNLLLKFSSANTTESYQEIVCKVYENEVFTAFLVSFRVQKLTFLAWNRLRILYGLKRLSSCRQRIFKKIQISCKIVYSTDRSLLEFYNYSFQRKSHKELQGTVRNSQENRKVIYSESRSRNA